MSPELVTPLQVKKLRLTRTQWDNSLSGTVFQEALKNPQNTSTSEHGRLVEEKFKTRTIHEKYKILKEIDRGSSCSSVAKNCNIPN